MRQQNRGIDFPASSYEVITQFPDACSGVKND
jgi:hypothetical protein